MSGHMTIIHYTLYSTGRLHMLEYVLGIRLAAAQLVADPVEVVGEAPEVDRSLYLSHS